MTEDIKEKMRALVIADAEPRFVFREYDIETREDGVYFQDGTVFKGLSLSKHLKGCARCALLAVTLGHATDKTVRRLQYTDMAAALVYDACANAFIEEVCDKAQTAVAEAAGRAGFCVTARYSPGYGDFALSDQAALLRLTNAPAAIGINLSGAGLLIPQKSVTAVIGYKINVSLQKKF